MTSFAKRVPILGTASAAPILIFAASQARAGPIENPPPVIEEKPAAVLTVVSPETLAARIGWGLRRLTPSSLRPAPAPYFQ